MAAPLSVCTKEEQRSVIHFCGLKVYQGPKYIEDFQHNAGTVFYPQRSVYEWIETFKNGHTSVTHGGSGACVDCCSAKNIFF